MINFSKLAEDWDYLGDIHVMCLICAKDITREPDHDHDQQFDPQHLETMIEFAKKAIEQKEANIQQSKSRKND